MPFRLCKLRYETSAVSYGTVPIVRHAMLDSSAWIEEWDNLLVRLGDSFHIEGSTWTVIEIGSETLPDAQPCVQPPKDPQPFTPE